MKKWIIPTLGAKHVAAITRDDCQRLHTKVGGNVVDGRVAHGRNANHALSILGSLLSWAGREPNPARMTRRKSGKGIRRFPEQKRERTFNANESAAIGKALREMEADGTLENFEAGFFTVLAVTGARPDELLRLTWGRVGDDYLDLGRTKGGDSDPRKKGLAITLPVRAVLAKLTRGDDDKRVFPVYKYARVFRAVLKRAGVDPVTGKGKAVPYTLRHTFGTRGATSLPLPILQTLMGHADSKTTAGYIHLAASDKPVREAANAHADAIAESFAEAAK